MYRAVEHVMKRHYSQHHTHQVAAMITVAAMVGMAGLLDANLSAEAEESADVLIRRVVAQTNRPGVAVRATRELRAGTRSGKHQGWMEVETTVTSSGGFTWKVIEEGGSERTRDKVFRSLLEAEGQQWRAGARDSAALTPQNYEFEPLPPVRPGQVQIRLKPRRNDPKLIDGTLTVSSDGYPLLLEGKMAKSPSFWVKSVSVVKRYGRFAGVALPTTIESLADVKIFGQSSFTMRYQYREVNGHPVSNALASAGSFGPSAEILALHTAR
jgi:hypothetical protein